MKLLEFTPKGNKSVVKSTLKSMIEDDVWMGFTPDLPALRYEKFLPVFMWDDLMMYQGPEKHLGINSSDYEVDKHMVYTKEKLLPFFNTSKDKSGPTYNMLPASPSWNMSLIDSEKKISINPRPVQGKLIHVNLFALRLFDVFYANTIAHNRRWETVIDMHGNEQQVWMYLAPTTVFTKYHPHEKHYKLLKGYDPVACSVVRPNNTPLSGDGRFTFKIPPRV